MINRQKVVITLLAMLPVLLISCPLIAGDDDHEEARQLQQAGAILPLEIIIEKAQAIHPGRILEVELESEHDRHEYEIELLDENGRVWELKFDAQTGQLTKQKLEN